MSIFISSILALTITTGYSVNPEISQHYQVLESNKDFYFVKINPDAFKINVFTPVNKPKKEFDFFINTNYFSKAPIYPIGFLKNEGEYIKSVLKYEFIRPIIGLDYYGKFKLLIPKTLDELYEFRLVIQSGPMLIQNSLSIYSKAYAINNEKFLSDVLRRTSHTAIGVTKYNKIILGWSANSSLNVMADKMMKYGAHNAINCDGGSSSSLKSIDKIYGNLNPKFGLYFDF